MDILTMGHPVPQRGCDNLRCVNYSKSASANTFPEFAIDGKVSTIVRHVFSGLVQSVSKLVTIEVKLTSWECLPPGERHGARDVWPCNGQGREHPQCLVHFHPHVIISDNLSHPRTSEPIMPTRTQRPREPD